MKVIMLTTVEMSSTLEQSDPLAQRMPWTVGHRVRPGGIVMRVDRIPESPDPIDLPAVQAERLVALGYAKKM